MSPLRRSDWRCHRREQRQILTMGYQSDPSGVLALPDAQNFPCGPVRLERDHPGVTAMSAQVNYVCWTSTNVTTTIPTEAATPSDAVLLATHAPLRIREHAGAWGQRLGEGGQRVRRAE